MTRVSYIAVVEFDNEMRALSPVDFDVTSIQNARRWP